MKTIIMTTVLSVIGFAYLALCAYGISRTGSAEGLADIGNTRLLGSSPSAWLLPRACGRSSAKLDMWGK